MKLQLFVCSLVAALIGNGFSATKERFPAESGEAPPRLSVFNLTRPSNAARPFDKLLVRGSLVGNGSLELLDGAGRTYASSRVSESFEVTFRAGGSLGSQRVILRSSTGELLETFDFSMDARTAHSSDNKAVDGLWKRLSLQLKASRRALVVDGGVLEYCIPWVRDETYAMKAYQYFEVFGGSLHSEFLDRQRENGMIYDYFRPSWFATERIDAFGADYHEIDVDDRIRWERLPVEADVEYLMVDGIYMTWKATGDDVWMATKLERLEKALGYMMSNPNRWSKEHQLVKRAYTIDTWDFKFYGPTEDVPDRYASPSDAIFGLDEDTPMCIMHGDNTGLFQACMQMGEMHEALGQMETAEMWRSEAEEIRTRLLKHAWNGRYFDQWVPIDPLLHEGEVVPGHDFLSLSNTYAMNRGFTSLEQSRSIINEYRSLRSKIADTHFAEWVSVYPTWEDGFNGKENGSYVNGGIISIVAGELALAAFRSGEERYGSDILERLLAKMLDTLSEETENRESFVQPYLDSVYWPDGSPGRGIPHAWGNAAILSSIFEGLWGIEDKATRFSDVKVAPRLVATDATLAEVVLRYGASDGYVALRYRFESDSNSIELLVTGNAKRFHVELLLPEGKEVRKLMVGEESVEHDTHIVGDSVYAVFELGPGCSVVEIELREGG